MKVRCAIRRHPKEEIGVPRINTINSNQQSTKVAPDEKRKTKMLSKIHSIYALRNI